MRRNLQGMGRYLCNLINHLAEVDTRNEYRILMLQEALDHLEELPQNFTLQFVTCMRPMRLLWEHSVLQERLCAEKFDLLHSAHDVAPRLKRMKSVVTFHDMSFFRFPAAHTLAKRLYVRLFIPPSLKHADHVIAVSEHSRRDILSCFGLDPQRVSTIHHGLPEAFTRSASDTEIRRTARRYGIHGPYILFVGLLEPRKNVARLMEAFDLVAEDHPHIQLVLAGAPGWEFEELLRVKERQRAANRILFTGFVPDDELPALFQGANLFAYPSLYEGFGFPVLEAMARGVPVVTSNVSSLPEIAGDSALLVNPRNVRDIGNAMARILSHDELRRTLVQKGIRRAEEFSWTRSAKAHRDVYEKVGETRGFQ
jgi:glycosyltransferase involved in cell wall biosynthesis